MPAVVQITGDTKGLALAAQNAKSIIDKVRADTAKGGHGGGGILEGERRVERNVLALAQGFSTTTSWINLAAGAADRLADVFQNKLSTAIGIGLVTTMVNFGYQGYQAMLTVRKETDAVRESVAAMAGQDFSGLLGSLKTFRTQLADTQVEPNSPGQKLTDRFGGVASMIMGGSFNDPLNARYEKQLALIQAQGDAHIAMGEELRKQLSIAEQRARGNSEAADAAERELAADREIAKARQDGLSEYEVGLIMQRQSAVERGIKRDAAIKEMMEQRKAREEEQKAREDEIATAAKAAEQVVAGLDAEQRAAAQRDYENHKAMAADQAQIAVLKEKIAGHDEEAAAIEMKASHEAELLAARQQGATVEQQALITQRQALQVAEAKKTAAEKEAAAQDKIAQAAAAFQNQAANAFVANALKTPQQKAAEAEKDKHDRIAIRKSINKALDDEDRKNRQDGGTGLTAEERAARRREIQKGIDRTKDPVAEHLKNIHNVLKALQGGLVNIGLA